MTAAVLFAACLLGGLGLNRWLFPPVAALTVAVALAVAAGTSDSPTLFGAVVALTGASVGVQARRSLVGAPRQ